MTGVEHETEAIERLFDIEASSGGDEACRTEGDELAARPKSKEVLSVLHWSDVDETLVEIERILIDAGTRSAVTTVDQAAVELEKCAKVLSEVQVGAQQITLQEVAAIGRLRAKRRMVLILSMLSDLPGDREEAMIAERDVVEVIGPVRRG